MSFNARDEGLVGFFGVSDGMLQVAYHGRVAVGSPGHVYLCDRDDGVSELV